MALAMLILRLWQDFQIKFDLANCMRGRNEGMDEDDELHRLQMKMWTPEHVFGRCCWRWVLHGQHYSSDYSHSAFPYGLRSCSASCNLAHPTIILYFEQPRGTIAVLSHPLDPFLNYFHRRVRMGKAVRRSPLYFELAGFVRENVDELRGEFPPHLIAIAQSALQQSDILQKKHMERRKAKNLRGSGTFTQLEEVLEICRLYRLADDMDAFSIYCLRRVSKGVGRVASRIARQKMKETNVILTPMVDGCAAEGFSMFRRFGNENTVVRVEDGRLVEYARCADVICSSSDEKPNNFRPTSSNSIEQNRARKPGVFLWDCQELSFANLEREWGDIVIDEYMGQNLSIGYSTRRCEANGNEQPSSASTGPVVALASFPIHSRLCEGVHEWKLPNLRIRLNVLRSTATQVDSVTVAYNGCVRIIEVDLGFIGLVRAQARLLENEIRAYHSAVERRRPLLDHERSFLREVIDAKSLDCAC